MGFFELLIMIPIALIKVAIPIATLVGVFLIYRKIRNIEQALTQRE